MKVTWMTVGGIVLLAAQVSAGEKDVLMTPKDMLNYSIGVEVVRNIRKQEMEVDLDLVTRGMQDALSGGKLLLPDKEISRLMTSFQSEVRKKQLQVARNAAEENRKRGEAFLAGNRAKEGVVTLPSGVQYRIVKGGDGRRPTDADTVFCSYRGTLINGTKIDSSPSDQRATMKVKGGVVPGLGEGLKLMPVGARWQIFIPANLAYGARGAGRNIGPNEPLVYEVELLAIK